MLAVSGCGAAAVAQNHPPAELARRQAAGEPVCSESTSERPCHRIADGKPEWGNASGGDRAAKNTGRATEKRPFPRDDARTALRAASHGLRACADTKPTSFDAQLRFENTGNVSSVTLPDGDEIGPQTASCVKARLSQISLLPFDGEPVTMKMRVDL